MALAQSLDRLWIQYQAICPQASQIHSLLSKHGERIDNDHIALRTFDLPGLGIDVVAEPFVAEGYVKAGTYRFPKKRLFANHFSHPSGDFPRIFISAFDCESLSSDARGIVEAAVAAIPEGQAELASLGRPWPAHSHGYETLVSESEYAGWLYAFGLRANHFTVSVNRLREFAGVEELSAYLIEHGFEMNHVGGLVKGSPADLLEQSATLASEVEVKFDDASRVIPGCYYEFAKRYPTDSGELFDGFVPSSADSIFHSTDRR